MRLRTRLLLRISIAALVSALAVAAVSAYWGRREARLDVQVRFDSIKKTLERSNFPLSENVIRSIAQMTNTQLAVIEEGRLMVTSCDWSSDAEREIVSEVSTDSEDNRALSLDGVDYLTFAFRRRGGGSNATEWLGVLFEREALDRASRTAAFLPLVTGLSTIVLLISVVLLTLNPIVRRLSRMQQRIGLVADGDFSVRCEDPNQDEIGALAESLDSMTVQLQRLWQRVRGQQSAKLLHQIAGGMAHQLRNTLTGSKLALELHQQNSNTKIEEVEVALEQIRNAEDYVSRLLLVGKGEQPEPEASGVSGCLNDIKRSLGTFADHLRIPIDWRVQEEIGALEIADRHSFHAAVSNLLMNAIQAAEGKVRVDVEVARTDTDSPERVVLRLEIRDDGPGISPRIRDDLFEPFVTTKSEGVGLGLPTVRQSAKILGGEVEWTEEHGWTTFTLTCVAVRMSA